MKECATLAQLIHTLILSVSSGGFDLIMGSWYHRPLKETEVWR